MKILPAEYKFDCIYFKGYKPCVKKRLCQGCTEYAPIDRKIVIVKLGALGDVLRTTPVLHALHRKYKNPHITWVTKQNAKDMLEVTPRIHRLVYVDQPDNGALLRLMVEEFDEMHCYDKEDAAIGLASLIKAKERFGFDMNSSGHMAPINPGAYYSFDLGLSDDLKFFKNKKSYQELTYESSDLQIPTPMDAYDFSIKESDRKPAQRYLETIKRDRGPLIGLNTGSGKVFRTKQWLEDHFLKLAQMLKEKHGATVLLLGGKDEEERNRSLEAKLKGVAHYPGANFTIREFAGFLEACDLVVTGDTLAMHLALSLNVKTIVLFGSTCDQEVDLYGLGEKMVSRPPCAPCYKNECDNVDYMNCMRDITPGQVLSGVERVLSL